MKTYYVTKRVSSQVRKAIENVLNFHEIYQNSYFWTPDGSADGRRSAEKRFSEDNPTFAIWDHCDFIEVVPFMEQSCKNVYYRLDIFVNGHKKNIRVLKNILKTSKPQKKVPKKEILDKENKIAKERLRNLSLMDDLPIQAKGLLKYVVDYFSYFQEKEIVDFLFFYGSEPESMILHARPKDIFKSLDKKRFTWEFFEMYANGCRMIAAV